MSDLKLFKLTSDQVTELPVSSMALEKSLQSLIEKHLETFLGVTFLASEYSTGPKTGGRMVPPATLAKAFHGELVPKKPNDDPAAVLLERIQESTPDSSKLYRNHRRAAAKSS